MMKRMSGRVYAPLHRGVRMIHRTKNIINQNKSLVSTANRGLKSIIDGDSNFNINLPLKHNRNDFKSNLIERMKRKI